MFVHVTEKNDNFYVSKHCFPNAINYRTYIQDISAWFNSTLHNFYLPGGTDGSFHGMTCETNIFYPLQKLMCFEQ